MEYLSLVSVLLFYIFLFALGAKSVIYFTYLIIKKSKKKNVRKIQAAISVLKLKLKAKIKYRSNKLAAELKVSSDIKIQANEIYLKLCSLDFIKVEDYRTLMNELRSLAQLLDSSLLIKIENIKNTLFNEPSSREQLLDLDNSFNNASFWKKLYSYEPQMLEITYNIVQLTEELKIVVEDYNSTAGKNERKFSVPESVEVECFELLWQLMQDSANDESPRDAKAS